MTPRRRRCESFDRRANLSKLVRNAQLKIYTGGSHSLGDTAKDQVNADLLAFVKA